MNIEEILSIKEFDTIGEFFEDEICGLYGCEVVIR